MLIDSIRGFIRIENEIENEKDYLARQRDFNLGDAFKIFDQRGYGYVTQFDLKDGLASIGLFPTSEELELWVKRYDTSGDRRITFSEFSNAFVSQNHTFASEVSRRPSNYKNPIYRRDDCFWVTTQIAFRSIWKTHMRSELEAESIRQRMQRMPYFDMFSAFNSLDLNGDGVITRDEFKRIIQSRGFLVSEKEATQIVEKMDKNKDGRVSFAEFSDEINPRSPQRRF